MTDYKFKDIIIAYTASELQDKLESVSNETSINPEGGLWAGVRKYKLKTDTFIDAFDRTEYEHDIYEPADEDGECCLGLYKPAGMGQSGGRLVYTVGELKHYLKEEIPPECKVVSVDDNFELNGAITENVKFTLLQREDEFKLELNEK